MSDIRETEPGVYSALDGTRSYEVRLAGGEVRVNGRSVEVSLEDSRDWNPRASRGVNAGIAHVKAPMPGKVVRFLVDVGDAVRQGQGVIVVEAMKMQNELKAPRDGRVASVAVRLHETVQAGAILVTIE